MKLVNIEETNNVGMLRRLNSQQNNHRIHLQFFKHDIFGHKLSFRKEKNPNTTTLKLEHFPISLNIFSIFF